MIGNKIADKITSIGKPKEKEKTKEIEEIFIPLEKYNRLLMTLDCFEHKIWHHRIKMEFQKIKNFLDTTSDDKIDQDLLLKSGLKSMINQKRITTLTKKSELKHQC